MANENFCALQGDFCSYERSKAVILPVPYEGTVTWGKGAAKGPGAIIEASQNMELYDEELGTNNYEAGICTLKPLKAAAGPEEMVKSICNECKRILNDKKFIIGLGGEHSISFPIVQAYREKYPSLSVLQLDAHLDLRESYGNTPYSHACVMKRILNLGCRTVQAGIRSMDEEEKSAAKKSSVFWARDIYDNENWFDKAINELTDDVYITIDLDAFDPSIMPATGTPEPGGLLWYKVMHFLKKVFREKNVVGFDIVELSPNHCSRHSDFLAAKLAYKLIGYKFMA